MTAPVHYDCEPEGKSSVVACTEEEWHNFEGPPCTTDPFGLTCKPCLRWLAKWCLERVEAT